MLIRDPFIVANLQLFSFTIRPVLSLVFTATIPRC